MAHRDAELRNALDELVEEISGVSEMEDDPAQKKPETEFEDEAEEELVRRVQAMSIREQSPPIRKAPIHRKMAQSVDELTEYANNANTFQGVKPRDITQRAIEGEFEDRSADIYGDQLLADIIRTMGEFGRGSDKITLRVDQQAMLAHCVCALLPLIYGNKLEANRKRLLKKLGLKRITQEVIILASRRVGKTWFVAMLLAGLMICVPKIEIACFSLALRTSQKMMRLVVDFLNMHDKGKHMIISHNQERLVLRGENAYNYKMLHSFPDQPDTTTTSSSKEKLSDDEGLGEATFGGLLQPQAEQQPHIATMTAEPFTKQEYQFVTAGPLEVDLEAGDYSKMRKQTPNRRNGGQAFDPTPRQVQLFIFLAFTSCIFFFFFFRSYTTVPAGAVGVVDTFGKVHDDYLKPGFHFVNPVATVTVMNVQTIIVTMVEDVPSKEGLSVHLEAAALYRLLPQYAVQMYKEIGVDYEEVIIRPQFRSILRSVTSAHEAKDLYTATSRTSMTNDLQEQLMEVVERYGIQIESTPLKKISLPDLIQEAIQQKLKAEQETQRMEFVLTKEAKEAERKTIEAQGIQNFQNIVREGIDEHLLRWKGIEATEKLADSTNAKVVIIGSGTADGLPVILNS